MQATRQSANDWFVIGLMAVLLLLAFKFLVNNNSTLGTQETEHLLADDAAFPAFTDTRLPKTTRQNESALVLPQADSSLKSVAGSQTEQAVVERVLDGDTVLLKGMEKVRYIGIDAPEVSSDDSSCLSGEASKRNKQLVEGKEVVLESDVRDRDVYGRLLRYVYREGVMVNELLAREGFARARSYPPDVHYRDFIANAQRAAQEQKLGIWSDECMNYGTSSKNERPLCSIKGNITAQGGKIFHVSGCSSYEKTRINESKGERYFCNEREAIDAGWRKARNC